MMTRLLMGLSDRLPARYIRHEGRPYLERYFLAHLFGLRVYLHHFVGSDPDGVHDHPWRYSLSIILSGWYLEQRRDGWRVRAWLNWITGDTFHRVVLPEGSPGVWSIFIHSGRVKPWGFLRERWDFSLHPVTVFEAAGAGDKPPSDWHKTAPTGRDLRMQHADLRASDADGNAGLVPHQCPVEGWMRIEAGQPCNWCGRTEPEPMPAVFRPRNRRAA